MKMSDAATMKLALAAVCLLALTYLQVAQAVWSSAHITYYGSSNGGGTMGGACGYENTYSMGYGMSTAALSTPLFQGGNACGACFMIRCDPNGPSASRWCHSFSTSITVTGTNFCPPGSCGGWCDPPRFHFDLPVPMFTSLAQQAAGVVPVLYQKVSCIRRGGVRFQLSGNPYFMMILIYNVGGGGDIQAVSIKGQYTGWIPMFRNWGSMWTCQTKLTGQALSFEIRTSNGEVLVTNNAIGAYWQFGQTWEGAQYR